MTNKKFLWIGCLESDKEFKIKASKGYNLASAQISQKNIMLGLEAEMGISFDSINGSVVPHYPIYRDKKLEEVIWSHKEDSYNVSVGFRNIKYLNKLTCKRAMIKAADKWVKNRYLDEELIIFVYSMRSASMSTACHIKRKIPNAKIYLIVTDLPQFMDLGESKIKTFLKKIDWLSIEKMQRKFDGFILYAEKMADFLKIPKDKWMLMEGLYNPNEILSYDNLKSKPTKVLMYAGKLDIQYGIGLLVDSFMKIDNRELELWITGGGNAQKYIEKCAEKDSRIKYYGFLPSRDDVIKKQKSADLLINMRLPSEEASKYCFPSKLLEYMVTGVPVLSFKLEGIPEEYYKYIFVIQDETEKSIISAIDKAFNMDEVSRREMGIKAKNFILENKSIAKQSQKILDWIKAREI